MKKRALQFVVILATVSLTICVGYCSEEEISPLTAQESFAESTVPDSIELGPDEVKPGPLEEPIDVEPLARGPMHESFAEQVNLDIKSFPVIAKQPPEPINEIPPEAKPDDDEVIWISGYWAWEDEREEFLWVSGLWRKPPPGRHWLAGQWAEVEGGWQWLPGAWIDQEVTERELRPLPPDSLEEGPTSESPSASHFWVPGCWVWRVNKYRWHPGYWAHAHENWIWVPDHYVARPGGCYYSSGYWDYRLSDRGWLFAPCRFHRPVYQNAHYAYRPNVVLDIGRISAHLFVRPNYCHYYFGDYYGDLYFNLGIVPWHHHYRRSYCPLLTYYNWHHRRRGFHYVNHLHHRYEHFLNQKQRRPGHSLAHLNQSHHHKNLKKGHFITEKKGQHGVLKQTLKEDYIEFLSGNFELKSDRDYTNIFGVDSDSNEMFFNKLNLK